MQLNTIKEALPEIEQALPTIEQYTAQLAQVREFLTLEIHDVDDRPGYTAVQEAAKQTRAVRLELQRTAKGTNDLLQDIRKRINDRAGTIADNFKEVEEELRARMKDIDDEKQRIKEAEERAALEKFNARVDRIFQAGAVYDGLNYVAGTIMLSPQDVQEQSDEWLEEKLAGIAAYVQEREAREREEAEKRAELERLLEEARKREEEAERARRQVEKEEAQRRFEADLDRIQAERKEPTISGVARTQEDTSATYQSSWPVTQPTSTPPGYIIGFNACRNKVLAILKSPEKMTRAQLEQQIRALEM